jgi:hypothetical protein
MFVTFFEYVPGKMKATAALIAGEGKFQIVDLYPAYGLETPIKASSYEKQFVYEIKKTRPSKKTENVYFIDELELIDNDKVITEHFYKINGRTVKLFCMNVAVPYWVWVDKDKHQIIVATGYLDDSVPGEELQMHELQRMAVIKDQASLAEFVKILHTDQPVIREVYRHLGHMKLFLIKGKFSGLVNKLFKTFRIGEEKTTVDIAHSRNKVG